MQVPVLPMIQLLEFYSLHLILCHANLLPLKYSSSNFSFSFLCYSSWLSSMPRYLSVLSSCPVLLMSFSNVLPVFVLLLALPFFKHILAHFSNPKFISLSLLIALQCSFHSSDRPHFCTAVSSHPHTTFDLFPSQFCSLDIHSQLCTASLLMQ